MKDLDDHPLDQKAQQIAFFHAAAVTCRRLASLSHDVDLIEALSEMAAEYDAAGEALALLPSCANGMRQIPKCDS